MVILGEPGVNRSSKEGCTGPGFTFRDIKLNPAFHRPQTLNYQQGMPVARLPTAAARQAPLRSQLENIERSIEAAELTYGPSSRCGELPLFIPSYVTFNQKVLCFVAYLKEEVQNSTEEEYRVRPVNIYYHLEDDSMEVYEPKVENSGLLQGKRTKRCRMLKNDRGEYYHWRDLNLAMDLEVCGFKYRITQCDAFTKKFMEEEGVILNEPEPLLKDPYTARRKTSQPTHQTPSDFDSLHQFLTKDCQVLRFFAVWDNPDNPDKKKIIYVTITYYLVNDTVEIREVHKANSGREPFPILMRRQKLPKKFKPGHESFPKCVLEVSPKEVDLYYSPKDFLVGKMVKLLDRNFLLYNCDVFTKNYYETNHPDMEMTPLETPEEEKIQTREKVIPPYNGFGSLEDSEQNCLHLIPKPLKKSMIKILKSENKVLRYSAIMELKDTNNRERHFVLSYCLSDDMITIYERTTPNAGIIGGKFLKKTRVHKPGSTLENPVFYSPADFAIGATVTIFSYRFLLTDADRFVLTYLESVADQIPAETLNSVRRRFAVDTSTNQPADQIGDGEKAESCLACIEEKCNRTKEQT